jgi:membrane-associated phospholipid phosphatase
MKHHIFEIFIICLMNISFPQVNAKNADQLERPDTVSSPKWYEMFTNIPGNVADFYDISFSTNKIPIYLGVSALTAGLIAIDEKTWQESHRLYNNSNFVKSSSNLFTEIGDGRTQFGIAAAFALYGFITSNNKALKTASQITQAVLASGGIVQVLKHITGRQSPYVSTMPRGRWDFFPNQIQYHKHVPSYDAYPSGHVTTALATVVVIAENYPENKWIKPVGYSLTGLLAISMVNKGIHWYSDYPLAIVLGYYFGMIAAHPEGISKYLSDFKDKKFQIFPSLVLDGLGLSLFYSM